MGKKQLKLSIPTPCSEDWNAMTADKNGRFCAACQKTVIDFSAMTDAQIIHYFTHFQGETCGRLSEKQLNFVISEPLTTTPNNRWAWALSALLLPTVAASQTVRTAEKNEIVTPSVFEAQNGQNDSLINIKLKGVVMDIRSEPSVGAVIHVKGTEIGVLADIDGRFQLDFPLKKTKSDSFEIEVIYAGFDTFSLKINCFKVPQDLKIVLQKSKFLTESIVVVGYRTMGKVDFRRRDEEENLVKELPLLKNPFKFKELSINMMQNTKSTFKNLFRKKFRD
jgi:hypothetical protein